MADYDDPEEGLFRGYLDEKTTPATTQETLDNLALASMFAPVVGDVAGGVADIYRLYNNPEERTPLNYGLMGMGMLPFVPNMGITKRIKDAGTGLASTVAQNLPNKQERQRLTRSTLVLIFLTKLRRTWLTKYSKRLIRLSLLLVRP
jgi:hypothetical protein